MPFNQKSSFENFIVTKLLKPDFNENVKGLLSRKTDKMKIYRCDCQEFKKGYDIKFQVFKLMNMDSSKRERLIIKVLVRLQNPLNFLNLMKLIHLKIL